MHREHAQTMIPMGIRPTLLEIMALFHAKREKLDREVVERIGGILDGTRQTTDVQPGNDDGSVKNSLSTGSDVNELVSLPSSWRARQDPSC
ncbi:hypothetical protein K0M31_007468 [Melipona bicolor]|uniref:Uncharacterized protein n=1 Tax=Melipona bicolor TaxID=60889 RepID=A0AA40GBT4_9HYME|nr:hypothetical protein K0M31_007468 [Melipona bicolor]